MAVVVIVGVMAAVAIPNLNGKGSRSGASEKYKRTVSMALDQARTRAMSERRRVRVTISSTTVVTQTETSPNTWQTDDTLRPPSEVAVWKVGYTRSAPTAIDTASHTITFRPDFTIDVDNGASLNAFVYIGPSNVAMTDARQLISVVASGSQQVFTGW